MKLYSFHDRGVEEGLTFTEEIIKDIITSYNLEVECVRPFMPHANPRITADDSFAWTINNLQICPGSLIVGVGIGGLIAAKAQETLDLDLTTLCISAPTKSDQLSLNDKASKRVAVYSDLDKELLGCCDWPRFTDQAFIVPWLMQHDITPVRYSIAYLVKAMLEGSDFKAAIERLDE